jgi:hypothetical protein
MPIWWLLLPDGYEKFLTVVFWVILYSFVAARVGAWNEWRVFFMALIAHVVLRFAVFDQ